MKYLFKTLAFIFCCLSLNLLVGQNKYYWRAYQFDGYKTHELRKVVVQQNGYWTIIANINPDTAYYWQGGLMNITFSGEVLYSQFYNHPTYSNGDFSLFDGIETDAGFAITGFMTGNWGSNYSMGSFAVADESGALQYSLSFDSAPSSMSAIEYTTDGGYLIVGVIVPDYPGTSPYYQQMYAVKLNHQFDIEWERIYNDMGFSYDNYLTDIMPAPDGSGYYLLGTVKWGANADIILLHIDHYGNPLNHHLFNINGMDQSLRFIPTPDGSLLISGSVQGELNVSKGVVLKVNEQGEIKWANQLFSATDVVGYIGPLLIAPDGNYVGAGAQRIVGSPKKNDVYIVKLAAETGAILWQRHYGGNKYEYCYDMIATTDGGYLMVGRQDTTLGALAYLIKTNCMGLLSEPQADFTFSTNANNLSATFYNQSQYVYPDSIDGGHYIWHFGDGTPPLQTQSSAPITHNYAEEGAYYTTLYAIVCQDTSIFEAVVKPQSGWGTAVGIPQTPPLASEGGSYSVVVYPNPAQNTLHFTLQNTLTPPAGWSVSLFTPAGQRVLHSVVSPVGTPATAGVGTPATASIQIGHLPVGMYFYTVEWGGVVLARGKLAVVR